LCHPVVFPWVVHGVFSVLLGFHERECLHLFGLGADYGIRVSLKGVDYVIVASNMFGVSFYYLYPPCVGVVMMPSLYALVFPLVIGCECVVD